MRRLSEPLPRNDLHADRPELARRHLDLFLRPGGERRPAVNHLADKLVLRFPSLTRLEREAEVTDRAAKGDAIGHHFGDASAGNLKLVVRADSPAVLKPRRDEEAAVFFLHGPHHFCESLLLPTGTVFDYLIVHDPN